MSDLEREAAAAPIFTVHVAAARARGVSEAVLARASADALKVVTSGWPLQTLGAPFEKFCEIWITAAIAEHCKPPAPPEPPLCATDFRDDVEKRLARGIDRTTLASQLAKVFAIEVSLKKLSPFSLAFLALFLDRKKAIKTWVAQRLAVAQDAHNAIVTGRKHDYARFRLHSIEPPTKTRSTWTLDVDANDHDMMAGFEMDGWTLRGLIWSD